MSGVLPGDRVAYLGPAPGAYCSVRTVPADWVVRLPAAIEDDVAAATLLKGITADSCCATSAASAPARACSSMRRPAASACSSAPGRAGSAPTVIGTVSSEAKARVAREHGCAHPIVTRDHRFADAVQAQFGGADVIVDGIGDAARDENFAALARRGHWISLGQASGALQPISTDAAGAEVDHLLAPGGVRLRGDERATWPSARGASGRRSPTAR